MENEVKGAKATRSRDRNGCFRCRRRRIRCDGSKPACVRCLKINVQCPGYEENALVFGLRVNDCFESDFEMLCFTSFVTDGTRDLARFQPSTSEFWLTIVPQLGGVHATIRHAIIALGVQQEPSVRPRIQHAAEQSIQSTRIASYHHFNKSIRAFLLGSASLGVVAKLTCCILYNELIKTLNAVPVGIEHVKAARAIISDHEQAVASQESLFEATIASTFTPMVMKLVLDALVYTDSFETPGDIMINVPEILIRMPSTAISEGRAFEVLDILMKYSIYQHRHGLVAQTSRKIHSELVSFGQNLASGLHEESLQAHIPQLKAHHRTATILANSNNDTEYQSEHQISLFNDIVNSYEDTRAADWTPSLGLIPPLFFTAIKCHDISLQEKALVFLHELHCEERGWTSCMATRVARNIVLFENNSESSIKLNPTDYLTHGQRFIFSSDNTPSEQRAEVLGTLSSLENAPKEYETLENSRLKNLGYGGLMHFRNSFECDCTSLAALSSF